MQYPVDKQEMQSFLRMVNFLTIFVLYLSEKTVDLQDLLKKTTLFDMTPHYKDIFDKVKKVIASVKTLVLYDPNKDLLLEVDVSTKGLGACLMQGGQLVSYASKSLSKAESNYSKIECKCLAVVFGLEHFKAFCFGRQVTIRSDHKPPETIFRMPIAMALLKLQRMLPQISIFDINVICIKGKEVQVANCLSCLIKSNRDPQMDSWTW